MCKTGDQAKKLDNLNKKACLPYFSKSACKYFYFALKDSAKALVLLYSSQKLRRFVFLEYKTLFLKINLTIKNFHHSIPFLRSIV